MSKQSKKCTKCDQIKNVSEFHKDATRVYGVRSDCKKCHYDQKQEHYRTKEGLVNRIYNSQKARSKRRKYPLPSYTNAELYEWLIDQDYFHTLYNKWAYFNYDKYLVPSVDRIDDYKSYTFDNIQLMTWKENERKSHSDCKNGINRKQCIPISKYTKDNIFIKRYYSVSVAARDTGIDRRNICSCCKDKTKSAGGFKWSFD